MNAKALENRLLAGLLVCALTVPAALAAEDDKKSHDMSPEAKLLPDDPIKNGWFAPDTTAYDGPYEPQEQQDIYAKKYMNPNPTGVPPVQLGIRLYDRGAYTPRPTW